MVTPTSWVTLVKEAYPDWAGLPAGCAIPLGVEVNQWDFGDAIDAVTRGNGRAAFIRRLLSAHPANRAHHEQFDRRFWNAFIEAEAFGWAQEIARLGQPEFIETEGAPDLRVAKVWIEAKTIEESEEEREATERLHREGRSSRGPVRLVSPDGGLLRKFESQTDDALRKLARQDGGRIVIFFDLRYVDFGIRRDLALQQVASWAETKAANSGSGIVVCFNHRWQEPFVSAGV